MFPSRRKGHQCPCTTEKSREHFSEENSVVFHHDLMQISVESFRKAILPKGSTGFS